MPAPGLRHRLASTGSNTPLVHPVLGPRAPSRQPHQQLNRYLGRGGEITGDWVLPMLGIGSNSCRGSGCLVKDGRIASRKVTRAQIYFRFSYHRLAKMKSVTYNECGIDGGIAIRYL